MNVVSSKEIDYREIDEALRNGGVIVYPTDTAYALGCDATNESAVKKVFEIKVREESKTVPLIAGDIEMVKTWAELSDVSLKFAQEYWPGPLTLVLPVKKEGLAPSVVKDGLVAVRVPAYKTARELSRSLGAPLVSTSANKAGEANCYSIESIKQSLGSSFKLVDYVIDQGELAGGEVSTIAKVWNNEVTIIRDGAIKLQK